MYDDHIQSNDARFVELLLQKIVQQDKESILSNSRRIAINSINLKIHISGYEASTLCSFTCQ